MMKLTGKLFFPTNVNCKDFLLPLSFIYLSWQRFPKIVHNIFAQMTQLFTIVLFFIPRKHVQETEIK